MSHVNKVLLHESMLPNSMPVPQNITEKVILSIITPAGPTLCPLHSLLVLGDRCNFTC